MQSWNGHVESGVSDMSGGDNQITNRSSTSPSRISVQRKMRDGKRIRDAYDEAHKQIEESDADLIIILFNSMASVIGHQMQADLILNGLWLMLISMTFRVFIIL